MKARCTAYRIPALPGFVWVEVKSPAVEEDGRREVLSVAEAPRHLLHALDHRVERLEAGIGHAVAQVGEQVGQTSLDRNSSLFPVWSIMPPIVIAHSAAPRSRSSASLHCPMTA